MADAIKCKHCGEWLKDDALAREIKLDDGAESYSNAQPIWQLIILSISTLGLYELYWFYKTWKQLNIHKELNIRPALRTFGLMIPIGGIILVYLLFEDIKKYIEESGIKTFSPGWMTTGYCLLIAIGLRILDKSSDTPDPGQRLLGLIASDIFFILALLVLARIQVFLNSYWTREQATLKVRTKLSIFEIVILIFGGILMFLIHLGTVIPD